MNWLLFFTSGLLASFVGGLVPGTVNLNVVYTTIQSSTKAAVPIIIAAAIGEVVLSFTALHCGMAVETYIQGSLAVQIAIASILLVVGVLMVLRRSKDRRTTTASPNRGFLQGLFLAILNPPVLVYWLLAFTYLASTANVMPMMSVFYLTLLYFLGVFIGKVLVLWAYMKLSAQVAKHSHNIGKVLNRVIGGLLVTASVVQFCRLVG